MDLTAFIAMGGYGAYIWGAVALALVMIIFEITSIRFQFRNILRRIQRIQRLRSTTASGG